MILKDPWSEYGKVLVELMALGMAYQSQYSKLKESETITVGLIRDSTLDCLGLKITGIKPQMSLSTLSSQYHVCKTWQISVLLVIFNKVSEYCEN